MVIVLSPQLCIEIAWISHGALAASVRRPCRDRTVAICDPRIFLEMRVPYLYTYSQEPTVIVPFLLLQNDQLKPWVLRTMAVRSRAVPVRGSCEAPTTSLQATGLRFSLIFGIIQR